jgi:hypothetical protein
MKHGVIRNKRSVRSEKTGLYMGINVGEYETAVDSDVNGEELRIPEQVSLSNGTGKGKVIPLRSIEAHLGDRRYSSYSFLTSALEWGKPPVPIV